MLRNLKPEIHSEIKSYLGQKGNHNLNEFKV